MFPWTQEKAVDMFPQTKSGHSVIMTYFLSCRAMLKQSAFCREKPNKLKVSAILEEKWMCVSVFVE